MRSPYAHRPGLTPVVRRARDFAPRVSRISRPTAIAAAVTAGRRGG
ncbi:MAG: hypothetical protein MZW92_80835 [Comamonadaceae bacterium]|nr:hypothetical protein [Comamonadaceae bacterium]